MSNIYIVKYKTRRETASQLRMSIYTG